MTKTEIIKRTDLTNLKANASIGEIRGLCRYAARKGYRAVCVNPYRVKVCKQTLKNSPVLIASVIDYPAGAGGLGVKVQTTVNVKIDGADEIDPVMNIGAYRDKNFKQVMREVEALLKLMDDRVKTIIETGYWNNWQISDITRLIRDCGALYIKTSTGLPPEVDPDTKARHIEIMKEAAPDIIIKGAGYSKTKKHAEMWINAGADILGMSARL